MVEARAVSQGTLENRRQMALAPVFYIYIYNGLPGGSEGKESACNAGDPGQIPR